MWGYGHGWGMGWGMGFGFIFWLVILGVIVAGRGVVCPFPIACGRPATFH